MSSDFEIQKRMQEIQNLKQSMGFTSLDLEKPSSIDLDRLSLLIDPTVTTRLYSEKKYIGPLLTWMRTGVVKTLYFLFKLDFSRLIELHQNVWVLAYQVQILQKRIEALESEQKEAVDAAKTF